MISVDPVMLVLNAALHGHRSPASLHHAALSGVRPIVAERVVCLLALHLGGDSSSVGAIASCSRLGQEILPGKAERSELATPRPGSGGVIPAVEMRAGVLMARHIAPRLLDA